MMMMMDVISFTGNSAYGRCLVNKEAHKDVTFHPSDETELYKLINNWYCLAMTRYCLIVLTSNSHEFANSQQVLSLIGDLGRTSGNREGEI